MELLKALESYCKTSVHESAKRIITQKYRNVFTLDDPFSNEPLDKYLLPEGDLSELSLRIKEDISKLEYEKTIKIYNKLIKFIDKLFEDDIKIESKEKN